MTTPLPPPPSIDPVAALAETPARRPPNAPAAARWLATPVTEQPPLHKREESLQQLLQSLYGFLPPEFAARLKAEAAGLLPSQALVLLSDHFDTPLISAP